MLYNSLTFFAFIIVAFICYWRLNKSLRLQNAFVLLASYFFYGCWDWRFLLLIAVSSIIDFTVGKKLGETSSLSRRKLLLGVSLAVNLGLLGFFKYFNFFIESATFALQTIGFETSFSSLSIILPVGISFYTFQTLSYTIDIYRGKLNPTRNWLQFFAFVSFFPQLVAGPIERATNLLPQFEKSRVFNHSLATTGMRLILWGLFKIMVIADRVAPLVETIFSEPQDCNSILAALGGVLFAFQVYCDFSGYSDIAIGSARLFGFKLMRNFITPFQARSMTELWQRWHISLSTWFRDYVYIPLGGNRASSVRWAFNIMTTFTLSGLWHGADFNYILWGFACSVPLVLERFLRMKQIGVAATFGIFSFLLILFRSEGMMAAKVMYTQLFSLNFTNGLAQLYSNPSDQYQMMYTFVLIGLFILAEWRMKKVDFDEAVSRLNRPFRWGVYYTILVAVLLFGVMDNAPQFIYFQF